MVKTMSVSSAHLRLFVLIQLALRCTFVLTDLPKLIFDKGVLVASNKKFDYTNVSKVNGTIKENEEGSCTSTQVNM